MTPEEEGEELEEAEEELGLRPKHDDTKDGVVIGADEENQKTSGGLVFRASTADPTASTEGKPLPATDDCKAAPLGNEPVIAASVFVYRLWRLCSCLQPPQSRRV